MSLRIFAAAVNKGLGLLSSTPCDSPLGDSRIDVRSAPATLATRSTTSRIRRTRFSIDPP